MKILTAIALLGIAFVGTSATSSDKMETMATETATTQEDTNTVYAAIYRPGPAWLKGKSMAEQNLRPHGLYIKQLRDTGVLVAGGPLIENDGGLAVFRVASLEDARAILASDPAINSGIFEADVQSWMIAFAERAFPVKALYPQE
ncbi:YciI family protein [Kordiimonas sp.]|uniref:YciI family protein n=1 Tax=Kordiimonas sp. TaxID=1970157 RepID=UPI003A943B37